jgi:hypothetical protein
MKAVKIRQVRQLLIFKLVQFYWGLSALTALNIAIREEFMLKKLSISISLLQLNVKDLFIDNIIREFLSLIIVLYWSVDH